MLDDRAMDALAHLSQRKGVLDEERVGWLRGLLRELGNLPQDVDVEPMTILALELAGVEAAVAADLRALVAACQGDTEAVAHANSLLDMAVRMQPAGRRRRGADSEPQQFNARVVGE